MKQLLALFLFTSLMAFISCGGDEPSLSTRASIDMDMANDAASVGQNRANTIKEEDIKPISVADTMSLSDKVVECICVFREQAHEFKKEIDAAPNYQQATLRARADERLKDTVGMLELNAEIAKMTAEEQKKFKKDIAVAVKKKCGTPAKMYKLN
jgi:hypothetical protein